ncbi:MAG TPA: PfkB family carbohydrate kinase [Solirubrobacteraceae bacterium]|nr:PfkB family carbohydrate kinase [Solirubrobacteraceae bacterium]
MGGAASLLCLGEALVDLIGEERGASLREVSRFTPHLGGTVANVAVFVARAGARVELAGAAGGDAWGRWVRGRLAAEGVGLDGFVLLDGVSTQLAFVAVDAHGEPTYRLYGEPGETVVGAVGGRVAELVAGARGLLISSNTLAGPGERVVTMRARGVALELGRPVVFDCNLRLHRWSSVQDAAAAAAACVPGAALVHANRAEAELMTGEAEVERAAAALVEMGARLVAITLGPGGAILRGAERGEVDAVPVDVVSTIGAGDAFTGTLVARLALHDLSGETVAGVLQEAAAAAARACSHWGSLD